MENVKIVGINTEVLGSAAVVNALINVESFTGKGLMKSQIEALTKAQEVLKPLVAKKQYNLYVPGDEYPLGVATEDYFGFMISAANNDDMVIMQGVDIQSDMIQKENGWVDTVYVPVNDRLTNDLIKGNLDRFPLTESETKFLKMAHELLHALIEDKQYSILPAYTASKDKPYLFQDHYAFTVIPPDADTINEALELWNDKYVDEQFESYDDSDEAKMRKDEATREWVGKMADENYDPFAE